MDFLEKDARVEIDDIIVTSGTDGIFPKGIMLGKVTGINRGGDDGLFQSVTVTPAVNLYRVEEVLIPVRDPETIEIENRR
jgi:rod shape-determining protein MreC